jgi:hypothetical protein
MTLPAAALGFLIVAVSLLFTDGEGWANQDNVPPNAGGEVDATRNIGGRDSDGEGPGLGNDRWWEETAEPSPTPSLPQSSGLGEDLGAVFGPIFGVDPIDFQRDNAAPPTEEERERIMESNRTMERILERWDEKDRARAERERVERERAERERQERERTQTPPEPPTATRSGTTQDGLPYTVNTTYHPDGGYIEIMTVEGRGGVKDSVDVNGHLNRRYYLDKDGKTTLTVIFDYAPDGTYVGSRDYRPDGSFDHATTFVNGQPVVSYEENR